MLLFSYRERNELGTRQLYESICTENSKVSAVHLHTHGYSSKNFCTISYLTFYSMFVILVSLLRTPLRIY